MILAILLAIGVWVGDALTHWLAGERSGSFAAILFSPSTPDLIVRLLPTAAFLGFGALSRRYVKRSSQAAQKVRESEILYRGLAEDTQHLVWRCDSTGCFTYLNPVWKQLLGFTPEEMIGHRFTEFQPPEVAIRDFRQLVKRIDKSEVVHETTYRSKTGEDLYVLQSVVPSFGSDGNIHGYQGSATDITERKRVERQLRLAQFATDHSTDMILWVEQDAKIAYANNAALELTGYKRHELQSMKIFDIDPGYTPEMWPDFWKKVKSRQISRFEAVRRTKEGKVLPVEVIANYLNHEGSELCCAIVRDISQRDDSASNMAVARQPVTAQS
jgi:PAS domain S-box-containing protein